MTQDQIRALAQADPTSQIVERWGATVIEARKAVSALEDQLRALDKVTADLKDRDLVVATALGPTGDAARAAFKASTADRDVDGFALPRAS